MIFSGNDPLSPDKGIGRLILPMLHLFLSLLLHGACFLLATDHLAKSQIIPQAGYIPLLTAAGFLLSVIMVILPARGPYRPVILGIKLVIIQLVFIPIGLATPLKTALLSIFVLETMLVLPGPWDFLAAAASFFITLSSQGTRQIWDEVLLPTGIEDLLVMGLFPLMVLALTWGLKTSFRSLAASRRQIAHLTEGTRQIVQANISFQDLAQEVEQSAMIRERKHITREIHDVVGYTLTNQIMVLEASLVLLDQTEKREHLRGLLETALGQAREGLVDVRSALHAMRLKGVPEADFLNRLHRLCRSFEGATGVKVTLESPLRADRIPPDLEVVIYRLVQEGLTNAFLHGKAGKVQVLVRHTTDELKVTIADDGIGADVIKEGIGLAGMRERLEPFGGQLACHSGEHGFTIDAVMPLERKEEP